MSNTYLVLAVVISTTLIGDYALKLASSNSQPLNNIWFFKGVFFYALTAIGWLFLMQTHNLAEIGVLYSSISMLALAGMGYFVFGEKLSPMQVVGLFLALASVYLVNSEVA